ncbi:MAG: ABC transporter ATP-binding protein [Deltaproteobacteria bacterium]|nr:ABC transporter ATP-binding protein [Deltaproteobacteria bacterium]
MAIIEVNHVTKEYRLGQMKSLKESFLRNIDRFRGRAVPKQEPFKALDNIDFKVEEGEVLGIIGTNGAGKSTLLKLLARVSTPTKGEIKVRGSVAPLIDVGAGLHPELTGRENIFLNGSIMGLSRAAIKDKFDEIVEFAELEEFIDTPIKRYSSGMMIRLGFSIATSVDADILIIDEVLAVGDLAFQRKCFDRMEGLIKKQGKTVLLVSHNIRQVERMCNRVILLDQGKVLTDGESEKVCNDFYQRSNEKVQSYFRKQQEDKAKIQTSGELELLGIDILDADGRLIDEIESRGMLRVRVRFELKRPLEKPEIVVGTHTTDFVYLSSSSTALFDDRPDYPAGVHEVEYIVPSFPLVAGAYCIRFGILDQHRRLLFHGETLKMFSVTTTDGEVRDAGLRTLNLSTQWKLGGEAYFATKSSNNSGKLDVAM